MKALFAVLLLPLLLVACSDDEAKTERKRASNPLADEQQLIRDAKSVEDMLNKSAEETKKAIENQN